MQKREFSNGGFVLHRIEGRRFSAWYDAAGNVLDILVFDRRDRQKRISEAERETAARLGKIHATRKPEGEE